MHVRYVRAAEKPIRRYIEELWLSYHRELGEVVDGHGLSSQFDIEAEVEWQIDRLDTSDSRLWVALDDVDNPTAALADSDATFAGFIRVDRTPSPASFDWPDRLVIRDLYVTESYRGEGVANQLVTRAVQFAREEECGQLILEVDNDNERALAYYRKLGFEIAKHRMHVPIEEIDMAE